MPHKRILYMSQNTKPSTCTVTHVSTNKTTTRQEMSEVCTNTDKGPTSRETYVQIEYNTQPIPVRLSDTKLAIKRTKQTIDETIDFVKQQCEI